MTWPNKQGSCSNFILSKKNIHVHQPDISFSYEETTKDRIYVCTQRKVRLFHDPVDYLSTETWLSPGRLLKIFLNPGEQDDNSVHRKKRIYSEPRSSTTKENQLMNRQREILMGECCMAIWLCSKPTLCPWKQTLGGNCYTRNFHADKCWRYRLHLSCITSGTVFNRQLIPTDAKQICPGQRFHCFQSNCWSMHYIQENQLPSDSIFCYDSNTAKIAWIGHPSQKLRQFEVQPFSENDTHSTHLCRAKKLVYPYLQFRTKRLARSQLCRPKSLAHSQPLWRSRPLARLPRLTPIQTCGSLGTFQ